MKVNVYSVYDGAVGAYLPPFFSRSKGEAIRSFTDAVVEPNGPFNKHKADFALLQLGTFDDQTGELSYMANGPQKIITALETLPALDGV